VGNLWLETCYIEEAMIRLQAFARRLGVALVPLGMLVACLSPTLPLPPPTTPDITAGVDSAHVTLSSPCGGVEDGAEVVVTNTNPTVPGGDAVGGAIATDCGAWGPTPIYAHSGDVLSITQQVGNQTSTPVIVQVP
jgi:hypothetical protein